MRRDSQTAVGAARQGPIPCLTSLLYRKNDGHAQLNQRGWRNSFAL